MWAPAGATPTQMENGTHQLKQAKKGTHNRRATVIYVYTPSCPHEHVWEGMQKKLPAGWQCTGVGKIYTLTTHPKKTPHERSRARSIRLPLLRHTSAHTNIHVQCNGADSAAVMLKDRVRRARERERERERATNGYPHYMYSAGLNRSLWHRALCRGRAPGHWSCSPT